MKKVKVGKKYVREGDTRKRPASGIFWTTIWGLAIIAYTTLLIMASSNSNFEFGLTKKCFGDILICSIPYIVFGIGFLSVLFYEKRERTIEYRIHQYERWDKDSGSYKVLYVPETVPLFSIFVYFIHIGDELDIMNEEGVKSHLLSLPGSYGSYIGYESKNAAMLEILEDIKRFVANDKEKDNIKIRNIKTLEVMTVAELKEQLADGKFDPILKDKII